MSLAQYTKVQPSVAIISAVSDLMRHLRKSIQYSLDDSNLGTETINWNKKFGEAVDRCLLQLSIKVSHIFHRLQASLHRNIQINSVMINALDDQFY